MTMNAKTLQRAAVLLTLIVIFFLLLANAVGASGAHDELGATQQHRVVSGETLWNIAQTVTPVGGDVRVTVYEIKRLNELGGSIIYPGELLVVPSVG